MVFYVVVREIQYHLLNVLGSEDFLVKHLIRLGSSETYSRKHSINTSIALPKSKAWISFNPFNGSIITRIASKLLDGLAQPGSCWPPQPRPHFSAQPPTLLLLWGSHWRTCWNRSGPCSSCFLAPHGVPHTPNLCLAYFCPVFGMSSGGDFFGPHTCTQSLLYVFPNPLHISPIIASLALSLIGHH